MKPGYRRINVNDPEHLPTSVYQSPNGRLVVAVAINDTDSEQRLNIKPPQGMKLLGAFQTDKERDCSSITPQSQMPPRSVRTLVFSK